MNWSMPRPSVGDEVIVYENLNTCSPELRSTGSDRPRVARVEEVYDTIIQASLWPSGILKSSLHHISDPGLQLNEQWRAMGGWDWGPTTKRLMALEQRVEALESAEATQPAAHTASLDPVEALTREQLMEVASAHGVEVGPPLNRKHFIKKLREAGVDPVEASKRLLATN